MSVHATSNQLRISEAVFDALAAMPQQMRADIERLRIVALNTEASSGHIPRPVGIPNGPSAWINSVSEKKISVSYIAVPHRNAIAVTLKRGGRGWTTSGKADAYGVLVACDTFVRCHDFVHHELSRPKVLTPFLSEVDAAHDGRAPRQLMKFMEGFEKTWRLREKREAFMSSMEKLLVEVGVRYWASAGHIMQHAELTKPTTPFAYLGALATAFETTHHIAPEWFLSAIRVLPSAATYDRIRRDSLLRQWRQRLLGEGNVVSTDEREGFASLRLQRQSPTRFRWQIKCVGDDWRDLTDGEKRNFEHDTAQYARLDTEEFGVVSAFLSVSRGSPMPLRIDFEKSPHHAELLGRILAMNALRTRVVNERGEPLPWAAKRLAWDFRPHPHRPTELIPTLTLEDGADTPAPHRHLHADIYMLGDEFTRGPHPISGYLGFGTETTGIPADLFDDPEVLLALKPRRMRRPASQNGAPLLPIRPVLRLTLVAGTHGAPDRAVAHLLGEDAQGRARVQRESSRWKIPPTGPGDAEGIPDLVAMHDALAHFAGNHAMYPEPPANLPASTPAHLDALVAWLGGFAPGVRIETCETLAALLRPADRAVYDLEIAANENSRDWFDLKLVLRPEDAELSKEDLQLLLAGKGGWVRLPRKGWRRLETDLDADTRKRLDDLGVNADAPHGDTHRFHAAQLAAVKFSERADAEVLARIRERAESIRAIAPPAIPAGLRAELRPYQKEGYHFLTHLSSNGLGGVLADDMGLGKTVQTIAWLLWLKEMRNAERKGGAGLRPASENGRTASCAADDARFLIVAPKSVTTNWVAEFEKFAPGLRAAMWGTEAVATAEVVVMNYARLRSESETLAGESWTAVVLDEGHYIKNPTSQVAEAARALRTTHRLVLSGTPVENRLLDLWSLYAFAMPGVLGTQAGFKRQYDEKKDPKAAARLASRVRPFLLRRTKAQVATDLPERSEEDLVVELEPKQRKLYDAEIKKARAILLKVSSARDFDKSRFNILTSLLRLRQICCDPRLVAPDLTRGDSSKLDALWELIEPLVAERHKVLVFSQFTEALELVGTMLDTEKVPFLKLTGATENRAELVTRFQKPDTEKVFLLSLKAAGTGLNLTAASYVVLFDPWWNPAAEAQAIDRTHRIGQKNRVIAYRLIAKNTVEEKIRALQRDKAALAGEILQEESLSKVLDIDTLRGILAE